jgi:hypothetical protein
MKLINITLVLLTGLCTMKVLSQDTNQWGEPVSGVQLSISSSNSVLSTGSTMILQCRVRNFSTNDVFFTLSDTRAMFEVSLISDSGKSYELNNPASQDATYNLPYKLTPGKTYESVLPLQVYKNIELGHYKLQATQNVRIQDERHKLVSNLLNIQIK